MIELEQAVHLQNGAERRKYPQFELPTLKTVDKMVKQLWEERASLDEETFKKRYHEASYLEYSFDRMTGLFNKQGYELFAQKMLDFAKQHNAPVGLLVMDGRRFKGVNDTYGHDTGDLAIAGMGDGVREGIQNVIQRRTDLIHEIDPTEAQEINEEPDIEADKFGARFGGDEFVVLVYGSDLVDIWTVISKLQERVPQTVRRSIEKGRSEEGDTTPFTDNVTLDIGLVMYDPARHQNYKQLFKEGDKTLYKIKQAIKNGTARPSDIGQVNPDHPEQVDFISVS